MRFMLIFIGAAVVAYLLTKGAAAFLAERKPKKEDGEE